MSQINTDDILRTLAHLGKSAVLFYVDNEPCLNVRHWTDQEQTDFCAEFGVSCRNGIVCALDQLYTPRRRFSVFARENFAVAAEPGAWENAGTSLPEPCANCEVKGKYTPDRVAYPIAKWDGEKWSSGEWRGMVAIEQWRYV